MPLQDGYDSATGRFYRSYIAHPRVGRVVGRLLWASDFGLLYRSLETLQQVEAEVVLDLACGAGLALGWLDPARVGRYVGVEASPSMLARAEWEASTRGFTGAELHLADVTAAPLPDGAADVCLLYNSLHCLPQPEAALEEAARCLKPSGRLIGSMLLRGESTRVDRLLERGARRQDGMMGPGGTAVGLRAWLQGAGFGEVVTDASGAFATFSARR